MTAKELKTLAKDIYGRCKGLMHGRLKIEVHAYPNFLEIEFHIIGPDIYAPLRVSRNVTEVAAENKIYEFLSALEDVLISKSKIKEEQEILDRKGKRLRKLIEKSCKDVEKA